MADAEALGKRSFARSLRDAAPEAKIVVFALGALDQNVLSSSEVGISGFVGRNGSIDDLILAIEQTLRGDFAANHELTALLIEGLKNAYHHQQQSPAFNTLTPRQRQIVPLLEQGLSNKEIARLLGIELATVKNHVHGILGRMQLSRRAQVAHRCFLASGRSPGSSERVEHQ